MSSPPVKWTAPRLSALKGVGKIVSVTAYDVGSARLADAAGVQLILVGDSLAMTVMGHANTLPVTLEEMLHHTRAVSRGVNHAMVVGDMPFLSYHGTLEQTLLNAGRFLKEAGADAVKIEGGVERQSLVTAMVQAGIPVMGHVGLQPQHVKEYGGFKVQGRGASQADRIVADAIALAEAGVFALIVEGVPSDLGRRITEAVAIPTVGIGAGRHCDGQILVWHDLLGLQEGFRPKFVRPYADLAPIIRTALLRYGEDVRNGGFPGPEESY